MTPYVVELFAGTMSGTLGFMELGIPSIGFDLEYCVHHGPTHPLGQRVIQDVLTLHGSQFKDALFIWASPPCQEYSYMAMPWSRGKQIKAALLSQGEFPTGYTGSRTVTELTALFDACFRIQREACEASGRYIPMIVENVRGAQEWVGRSAWHHGSFHLWGDVPALMPITLKPHRKVVNQANIRNGHSHTRHLTNQAEHEGVKSPGMNWSKFGESGYKAQGFNVENAKRLREMEETNRTRIVRALAETADGIKLPNNNSPRRWEDHEVKRLMDAPIEGVKAGKAYRGQCSGWGVAQYTSSNSSARKAASALIARIPPVLARHIARVYAP